MSFRTILKEARHSAQWCVASRGIRVRTSSRVVKSGSKLLEQGENIPLSESMLSELHERNESVDQDFLANEKYKKTSKKQFPINDKTYRLREPITVENQYRKLADWITPLHEMPYNKQLSLKYSHVFEVLKMLSSHLQHGKVSFSRTRQGLPCPLEPVRPSPDILAYRNKDDLCFNKGADGNPKTLGFYIGKPTDPLFACVPCTYLLITRENHKKFAQHFQEFVRQSRYPACLNFKDGGLWRTLGVRSTQSGELMGTVIVHPQDFAPEVFAEVKEDLQKYFFEGPGTACGITSLYFQQCPHTLCTPEQAPFQLIHGHEYITETCLGQKFQISPGSFFQVNTLGAEVLYSTIQEIAEVSPVTTVLDLCCGTGTISVIMSPHVRSTIGIDIVSTAVADAKRNALLNNALNSAFLCGSADKVLPHLTPELNNCMEVIAVVNPSRGALDRNVIQTIRECESIKKLVYISCRIQGRAENNILQLCARGRRLNRDWTDPFIPRYAVPVDMFPHTKHVELVMLFER